jgi:hypothetical protein
MFGDATKKVCLRFPVLRRIKEERNLDVLDFQCYAALKRVGIWITPKKIVRIKNCASVMLEHLSGV